MTHEMTPERRTSRFLNVEIDDDITFVDLEFRSFVNIFHGKLDGEWVEFLITLQTG